MTLGMADDLSATKSSPPCKLCGGATGQFIERNSHPIVKCRKCGFMFALLPPDVSAETQYVNDSYFSAEAAHGITDYDSLWDALVSHMYVPRLKRMLELGGRGGKHLDIGCAGGNLIVHASELGWECYGVELSQTMRSCAAQRTGRPIFASLNEARESGLRFDSVTMFGVIEHLEDPPGTMRQVAAMTAADGMIALSTPNFENPYAISGALIDIWFIPPEHISYFNRSTITGCMTEAGYRISAMDGIFGAWRAWAGDTSFPRWLTAALKPWRKNKRLRPGGLLGAILKRAYGPAARPELYRRRDPADLRSAEVLEIYARRAGNET